MGVHVAHHSGTESTSELGVHWDDQYVYDLGVHRDDHYVFLLQERGESVLWLDFEEQRTEGTGLYFINPGQVHAVHSIKGADGWFLAAEAHLVAEPHQQVFRGVPVRDRWLPLEDCRAIQSCLTLMLSQKKETDLLRRPTLHALVAACAGLIAEAYAERCGAAGHPDSRAAQVTRQFQALLAERCLEEKRPSAYAASLNLSLSYLNEMVRSITGLPVGHWIQQEVMMEARRLLYYSDLTVQEIAYRTGYEDPAYFSRVFRQAVGQSPQQFRQLFRR